MNETTVNIPLLRKAVEWAEAEAAKPYEVREWFQPMWNLDPREVRLNEATAALEGVEVSATKAADCGTCYCIAGFVTQATGGDFDQAEQVGREELGLSERQASYLFNATNSIADVRRIAESIAGERL